LKNVRVELDDELHMELKLYAVKNGKTIQEVVVGLIKNLLDKESDNDETRGH